MAVRLLFPTYVFERDLLDPNLSEYQGCTQEYFDMLKDEMDTMRVRDPEGRRISNAYTGWQSNDGIESHPTFTKVLNRIERLFIDEVLPFHGYHEGKVSMKIGNSWANINEYLSWNKPHLHNGCWYSGVLYIHADSSEQGDIEFIDTHTKVVANFPHSPRTPCSFPIEPKTGKLILFPSGLMHMVAPNVTPNERYSISFNMEFHGRDIPKLPDWDENEFLFNIDKDGNPIIK